MRPLPTALFALSDEMAFGALMAARELGIAIPGDISLVGVDDHEFAAVMGLTTVRQDVVEHGARGGGDAAAAGSPASVARSRGANTDTARGARGPALDADAPTTSWP